MNLKTVDTLPLTQVVAYDYPLILQMLETREMHFAYTPDVLQALHHLRSLTDTPLAYKKVIVKIEGEARFVYRISKRVKKRKLMVKK